MESRRRFTPENPANFIKVILSGDTRSTGIRVPEKFIEKHGGKLRDRVILKVPNGDVWQVDLEKSKDEIWLKAGWREFAEYYSLDYGNLLMFKYEGFSIFGVIIFDLGASEMVYPVNRDQAAKGNSRKGQDSCKKVNFTEMETVKLETSSSWSEDQEFGVKINDGGECSRKRQRMNDRRKSLERAKAKCKCEGPFFRVYMHQSSITSRSGLQIPKKFLAKDWRGFEKHSKCLLQLKNDEGQRTWELRTNKASLSGADWMIFVKDNGISVGDVCVFELIHKDGNVLDVSIIRSHP